jgi:hypothetical protein
MTTTRKPPRSDPVHIATISASAPLAARTASLRRSFIRLLGRRPNAIESYTVTIAAALTARSEIAALDPSVGHEECARIAGAAARARDDWARLCKARQRTAPPVARSAPFDLAAFMQEVTQ